MSTPTVPEPVASFLVDVTAHDDDAAIGRFTEDAVVDDWGTVLEGREAIRAWSDQQFVGSKPSFTVQIVREEGGDVLVAGDWRSQHANGPSAFRFTVDGDAITRMVIREG